MKKEKEKPLVKQVKPFGNTGHITLPKKYVGKVVKVIIKTQGEHRG